MERKAKLRKICQIVAIVLVALVFLLLLSVIISFNNTDSNEILPIFGYSLFSVISQSMSPVFDTEDIIVIKAVKPGRTIPDYNVDDIITYQSFDVNNLGVNITHRIIEITPDGRYITKGDKNEVADPLPIYPSQILGKYVFKISGARKFVLFLRSPYGYVLFILVPSLLLIALEISLFIGYFKKYKVKQDEEKLKEREQKDKDKELLEKEIDENRKLREEINKLKADLLINQNNKE